MIMPQWWTGSPAIDPSNFTIDCGGYEMSDADLAPDSELATRMRQMFHDVGLVHLVNTGLTDLARMRLFGKVVVEAEMAYEGGANPRDNLEANVYEVGAPLVAHLHYHHEMAYVGKSTKMVSFLANKALPWRGATYVADSVAATDALLATDFGQKLKELGVCYQRNLSDRDAFADQVEIGVYNHWQKSMDTEDPAVAEAKAQERGLVTEWGANRLLKTRFYVSAFEYFPQMDSQSAVLQRGRSRHVVRRLAAGAAPAVRRAPSQPHLRRRQRDDSRRTSAVRGRLRPVRHPAGLEGRRPRRHLQLPLRAWPPRHPSRRRRRPRTGCSVGRTLRPCGEALLISVAERQKQLHQAAASYGPQPSAQWATTAGDYFPSGSEGPLMCHNDFSITNTIVDPSAQSVVGVVDWDFAAPVDPLFDIMVTARHWLPLAPPQWRVPSLRDADVGSRLALFADAHGLSSAQRTELIALAAAFIEQAGRNIVALAAQAGPGLGLPSAAGPRLPPVGRGHPVPRDPRPPRAGHHGPQRAVPVPLAERLVRHVGQPRCAALRGQRLLARTPNRRTGHHQRRTALQVRAGRGLGVEQAAAKGLASHTEGSGNLDVTGQLLAVIVVCWAIALASSSPRYRRSLRQHHKCQGQLGPGHFRRGSRHRTHRTGCPGRGHQ
ncbi:hypothetical protein GQR58_030035 [Nymphon striatum]|nr:hypothetical protein GQR58_030035 [Nymphon striatum]